MRDIYYTQIIIALGMTSCVLLALHITILLSSILKILQVLTKLGNHVVENLDQFDSSHRVLLDRIDTQASEIEKAAQSIDNRLQGIKGDSAP